MKTLKKALCLVLSVVMVLGLCAISVSAAPDTEKADEEYQTALKVLEEVGALQGVDDAGNLNPKAELKRIEGAVIIARLLGYLDETKLDGSKAKAMFPDIPAWAGAAGAASLLVDEGISDGTTDANGNVIFGSAQALTGDMFAKWLLCALGYDATIEGMTGSDWEIAVNKLLMKEAPLDANITGTFPATKALTREQAAQMMLDALQTTMVEYTGGTKVTVDGIDIVTGAVRSNQTTTKAEVGNKIGKDSDGAATPHYDLQLGEYLYKGKLSLKADRDDYFMDAKTWYYPDEASAHAIDTTTVATVLKSYTKGSDVTGKALAAIGVWDSYTIANDVGGGYFGIGVYTNGHDAGYMLNSDVNLKTTTNLRFPNGAKIDVVDNDGNGNPDRVCVTYGYLGVVNSVNPATSSAKRSINVTLYTPAGSVGVAKYPTTEFAKGDYVIAYPDALLGSTLGSSTELLNVEAATPTSGAVSAYVGNSGTSGVYTALSIDGGSSKTLGSFISSTYKPTIAIKDKVNVYELNGYVIGIVSESNSITDLSKLVYVLGDDAGKYSNSATNPTTGKATNYVRVIRADTGAFEVIASADPSAVDVSVSSGPLNQDTFYTLGTNSTTKDITFTKVAWDGTPTTSEVYRINTDATPYSATAYLISSDTITASSKTFGTTTVNSVSNMSKVVYSTNKDVAAIGKNVYISENTKFVFYKNGETEVKVGPGAYTLPENTQIVLTKDTLGNFVAATVIVNAAYASGTTADSKIIFMDDPAKKGEDASGNLYSVYELDGDTDAVKYAISNVPASFNQGFYTYSVNESGKGVISYLDGTTGAAQWNGGSATSGVKTYNASAGEVAEVYSDGGKLYLRVGTETIVEITGATVKDLTGGGRTTLEDIDGLNNAKIYVNVVNNVATQVFLHK